MDWFKVMIGGIFVLVVFAVVEIFGFSSILNFKVDIQRIGQEEFDRFVLVDKVLNAEGCTLGRGIFDYDKVKESDKFCRFKECTINTNVNWGYFLISEELNLDTRKDAESDESKSNGCSREGELPKFRFSQSVPVLIYNSVGKSYHSANLVVYGPKGVITASLGRGNSLTVVNDKFYADPISANLEEFENAVEFECNAPETKGSGCVLDSIETSLYVSNGFTGGDVELEVNVRDFLLKGSGSKSTGGWGEKISSVINFPSDEIVLENKERENIFMKWKYTGKGVVCPLVDCSKTYFDRVEAKLTYRVSCPVGMIVETQRNEKDEVIYTCKEELIGEELE